jgi:hypothetical protein
MWTRFVWSSAERLFASQGGLSFMALVHSHHSVTRVTDILNPLPSQEIVNDYS